MDQDFRERDLTETFAAVFRLGFAHLGPVMLCFGLPMVGFNILLTGAFAVYANLTGSDVSDGMSWVGIGNLASSLWLAIGSGVLTVYLAARYRGEGGPGVMSRSFGVFFRRLLPLLGTLVLAGLAIFAGTVLLIVPGIILVTGWFCLVPLTLLEKVSVFRAFSRTWQLTRRKRLPILGLMVLFGLMTMFFQMLLSIPLMALMIVFIAAVPQSGSAYWFMFLLMPLANLMTLLLTPLGSALPVVVYYNLIISKEGLLTDNLRKQFDSLPEGAEL